MTCEIGPETIHATCWPYPQEIGTNQQVLVAASILKGGCSNGNLKSGFGISIKRVFMLQDE
jgi:hypothetical protein